MILSSGTSWYFYETSGLLLLSGISHNISQTKISTGKSSCLSKSAEEMEHYLTQLAWINWCWNLFSVPQVNPTYFDDLTRFGVLLLWTQSQENSAPCTSAQGLRHFNNKLSEYLFASPWLQKSVTRATTESASCLRKFGNRNYKKFGCQLIELLDNML